MAIFNGLMDLLLLIILSGVFLALVKRFKSGVMGMKSSTKHTPRDRWALAFLWLIFPLRLFAESLTAGFAGNGSFLTQPLGNMLAVFLPVKEMAYFFWWGYSVALGSFLVALPYSRYMHIPTEIFLIFLKNWGFKPETTRSGLVAFELYSCSRCGICIDPCQMDPSVSRNDRMVYFLRDLRAGKPVGEMAQNCLLCGRCQEICPVGIDLTNLRLIARKPDKFLPVQSTSYPAIPLPSKTTDVIYFSGCMGSLTPGVRKSMEIILRESGVNYLFLDKEKSYCCGRPLKLTGRLEEAKGVSKNITDAINSSGASTLVTSCPICCKSFMEDSNCKVRILHHSEYLLELVQHGLIKFQTQNLSKRIVYHDPCELGRKSGVYAQPRQLLAYLGNLIPVSESYQKSLCCGGSPGNLTMSMAEREVIQQSTAAYLNQDNPDYIATACPLCKKSLSKFSEHTVIDIAELVARNMISHDHPTKLATKPDLAEILAD